jgi:hypothetical protein
VFLLSSVISGIGLRIRLLGIAQNAELITSFYLRRRKSEVAVLEIAGPNICESADELDDPELVLHRMRATEISSACGGWHVATDTDYLTYALIARMQRTGDTYDNTAAAYYRTHPLQRALSFIPTLSEDNAAKLLKTIIDPRWYVDRRAPERQGKLEIFMGLTPGVQKRVSDSTKLLHRGRDLRCSLVLDTWKTAHAGGVDLQNPQNFLYRVHNAAGGGSRGDLRGSQAFLRYLRYNRLAALSPGVKDGLFAPDMFFKTPGERASYEKHMAQT